ncbi:hypothetical protein PLESTM_000097900 [Pleodorina starrii]|nr:hypothetical protein PLESTM_000097900 [Pleodorina starrii]
MPRARRGRHQADKNDEWTSGSTEDDLPDWFETDMSHLEDLRLDLLAQPRTWRDVMQHPAILRRCHFRPLSALDKRLQRLILSKLQRLEDSLPYADEALEAPGRVHVLLWLPPKPAASPSSQDDTGNHNLSNLMNLLDAADLRRTCLTQSQRRAAAAAAAGTAAAAVASLGPEPDPHLLGFCLLARRRDPVTGGRYNAIEFFNTLVNGYNLGQLLFERAGELCHRSHPAAVNADSGAAGAAAAAAAAPAALSLASWPLPNAPKNIFYWIKLERIPALGCGGLLRAFAGMRLLAAAAAVPAPAEGAAPAGDCESADATPSGVRAGNRSAGGRSRPRSAAAAAGLRRSGGRAAPLRVGGILSAFRQFCVQELHWEPIEVEAYMEAVGGDEAAAALLEAAVATRTAAPGREDGDSAEPPAAAEPAIVFPGAEGAPADTAAAAAPPPPPPQQRRRRQQVQAQRQLQGRQSKCVVQAAAAARGGTHAAESSLGCCVGGAAAKWRGREVGRWALCAAGRGHPLRPPLPAPVPQSPIRRHTSGIVRCYSVGSLSHSGRAAVWPMGCGAGVRWLVL